MRIKIARTVILALVFVGVNAGIASAAPFFWTDWLPGDTCVGACFTATGTLTTTTSIVTVTYNHSAGVGFYQTGAPDETDWWVPRPSSNSPYTSTTVDNIPTGTDIIALSQQGSQTLTFSESIANPVFAFVSMNGNGYAFLNQDFTILSISGGNIDGQGVDACGAWGCGSVQKVIEDIGGGNFLYKLVSTGGEPHGVIQFSGAFSTLTWNSNIDEFWNGFTVGVQGTAREVIPPGGEVPEPGTLVLLGSGLALAIARARRRRA